MTPLGFWSLGVVSTFVIVGLMKLSVIAFWPQDQRSECPRCHEWVGGKHTSNAWLCVVILWHRFVHHDLLGRP